MSSATPSRFTRIEVAEGMSSGGTNFVANVDDLPGAVNGVIALADNQTYFLTGDVDLKGARLVGGRNTCIIGGTSENCALTSTGLDSGTALLSSEWTCILRFMTISHGTALNLDADGNADQALDWLGVNFLNCATVGTIANYNNWIYQTGALLNSSGLTVDGTFGTVGLSQCLINPASGGTGIIVPATATITRRFRVIYSAFVVLSGETGIDVSTSATIPVEGHILDTVNFAGGGTYTAGVAFDDNKALWVNNKGIKNSAEIGFMTLNGNATATSISTQGVPVKASGATTLQAISQKFSHSDNRLTYSGAITRSFKVTVTASVSSGANNVIGNYVAKNGTVVANSEIYITANSGGRAENVAIQTVVELAQNDFVEFFVENDSGTSNITVTDMAFIAEALN